MSFEVQLKKYQTRLTLLLAEHISSLRDDQSQLKQALEYSVNAPGKRIRPALVYTAGELFSADNTILDIAAVAVELIHTYSLVHDDLPAMDNDDLRRGRPTCHKAFNEATAILVGDGLQTLAFSILSADTTLDAKRQLQMIQCLTHASGCQGMVAGQAIDMSAKTAMSVTELETMHQLKTGALIKASLVLGALANPETTETEIAAMESFGEAIGLAFQIQDDILDVTASSERLGKPAKSDIEQNKSTFVSIVGLEKSKELLSFWHDKAISALHPFGARSQNLLSLADYIISRDY